jgi:5-methylcytosine-specific restriction endonuclease McrA
MSYRNTLRKFIAENSGYKCNVCDISEWNNNPLTLQVNHIDGDASNNDPNNLELICPNCHTQTSTYGGKNKGNGRKARGLPLH